MTSSGIIHFTINAQQLIVAPFEILPLQFDDNDLVPEGTGRGRYRRQP